MPLSTKGVKQEYKNRRVRAFGRGKGNQVRCLSDPVTVCRKDLSGRPLRRMRFGKMREKADNEKRGETGGKSQKMRHPAPEAASQETCSFVSAGQASEKSSSQENRSSRRDLSWTDPFFNQKGMNMEAEQFSRTELLLGEEAMEILKDARVAVFGIGGVGGYVVEALARSGVGALDLIDKDRVCLSNLNRQIIATRQSIGRYKTEVMRERILDINPEAEVRIHNCFYLPETKEEFDFSAYSYVVDAVDTVTAKLSLVEEAAEAGVPIISSMGAGNKLNPFLFEAADIYETSVCPLARVMRRELRKRGIDHLKVVYSREEPLKPLKEADGPGSTAFVPSVAGLLIASEVIRDLTESAVRRARMGKE